MKRKLIYVAYTIFTIFCILGKADAKAYCNHEWSEWKVWIEATCSEEGWEDRVCQKCYDEESRKIPATGIHKWSDWKECEKATCTEQGTEERKCSECYETEERTVPKTGIHIWTSWKANGYLCEDGKYTRYCKECYKEQNKKRKGNGKHLYSSWEVTNKADCLNKGKKYRYCRNCYSYFYKSIPINPKAHNWSSWNVNYAKKKRIERTCYTCGKNQFGKASVSPKKKTLKIGQTFTLNVNTNISGDKISKYSSSNKKIADINRNGKVTAKNKGTAKITARMKSGCMATCTVTVK